MAPFEERALRSNSRRSTHSPSRRSGSASIRLPWRYIARPQRQTSDPPVLLISTEKCRWVRDPPNERRIRAPIYSSPRVVDYLAVSVTGADIWSATANICTSRSKGSRPLLPRTGSCRVRVQRSRAVPPLQHGARRQSGRVQSPARNPGPKDWTLVSCQRGSPITESNLSLHVPAQVAAVPYLNSPFGPMRS